MQNLPAGKIQEEIKSLVYRIGDRGGIRAKIHFFFFNPTLSVPERAGRGLPEEWKQGKPMSSRTTGPPPHSCEYSCSLGQTARGAVEEEGLGKAELGCG